MMNVVGKNKSSIKGASNFEKGAGKVVDLLLAGQTTRLLSEIPGLASIDKPVEFVKGLFGGNKRKKQQKESVKRIVDYMQSSGANLSESQIKDMNKNRGETIKQFEKTAEAETEAATMLDKTYSTRLDSLEKISGKSRPELELLAKEMGVDLYDSTVKFKDVLGQMGLAMVKTSAQMRQAFTDVYVKGFDTFSQYIKQAEAASSYNEIGENYRALVAEGGSTDLDFAKFMQDLGGAALDRVGGNSLKAFYDISGQMGYEGRQGTAFGATGIFAGQTLTPAQEKLKNAALSEQEKGLAGVAAQQLADIYANKGATIDTKTLEKQLLNMSPDQQQKLFTQLQAGEFDAYGGSQNTGMNFGAKGIVPMLSAGLNAFGLDPSKLSLKELPGEKLDAVATAMTTASTAFKDAVDSFTSKTGAIFQSIKTPDWLNDVNSGLFSGQAVPVSSMDTSSPRGKAVGDTTSSRLSQTMSRHSAIDGTLSGKRTITSGYRNWGLGSLGSDHLTGRAVDVVGDNLVSYRDAVKRNGGFAEFHGDGANRHVHAVPGAIGDGRAPASYQPARSGSSTSGGGMSVTVNINGANSSPEEIANRVMAKIKDAERARRERS
jgi:DNA polymerase/3'-5' exonuclease PolX